MFFFKFVNKFLGKLSLGQTYFTSTQTGNNSEFFSTVYSAFLTKYLQANLKTHELSQAQILNTNSKHKNWQFPSFSKTRFLNQHPR